MGSSPVEGCFQWVGWEVGLLLLLLGWVMAMVVRAVRWVWWTPRRLERVLREQGIGGNPYRLLFGDVRENTRLTEEAKLKPMPTTSHDIAPRVVPLQYRAMKAHGKVNFTWFGPYPQVSIMDPTLVRELLLNKAGDLRKQRVIPLASFIATGLVTYDGEKWVMHRKTMNPAFHAEKLKHMWPAFSACCSELINRWEKLLGAKGSCEVDVWPELQIFSRDVLARTAFGSSFEEGRRIFELQQEQVKLAFQSAQSWLIPGYGYIPTKVNRRIREIFRVVRELIKDMIIEKEKAIQLGRASDNDLLSLLLRSDLAHFQENGVAKTLKMTMEDLIEECKLFYVAGQETTSELLTWAMVALSMHPNWQECARAEVLRVFGKNKPDFDSLSQLKIVTMILYEVLRLYPPGASIHRRTYKTLKLGGYTFPPGVQLVAPILLLHHDPEFWGEDAEEFKPERFAEGVSKASKNQMVFFPFGGGPRICIGQNFAMMQAKMGLATILQHFSFELSPTYTHAPYTILSLQPQHGAQVILHKL